jgi:hypothetical protein
MNTHRLIAALAAARRRTQRIPVPARLPELHALQRRAAATRPGGDSRPVQYARALFDDVQ